MSKNSWKYIYILHKQFRIQIAIQFDDIFFQFREAKGFLLKLVGVTCKL